MAINMGRVTEKLDSLLNFGDFQGAERHLEYWLSEAEAERDFRSAFSITNELIGLFRKCSEKEKAFSACEKALGLTGRLGLSDEIAGATAYINIATAYKSFGEYEGAIPLYEKAEKIYCAKLPENDARFGGLYNNKGLALTDAKRYAEARECYEKAVSVMLKTENGELEAAITLLNMVDLNMLEKDALDCIEENDLLINGAYTHLKTPALPRNNYYLFVAEKCIPVFNYYGYFGLAEELTAECEKIRQEENR